MDGFDIRDLRKNSIAPSDIVIVCKKEWQGLFTTCLNIQSLSEGKASVVESSDLLQRIWDFSEKTLLLVGCWDRDYDNIVKLHSGRIFVYWVHPLTKSELSSKSVEIDHLCNIKRNINPTGIEKVFTTCHFLSSLPDFEYLPIPISTETSGPFEKIKNSIGCFFEHDPKKNIISQLAACKSLDADVFMNTTDVPSHVTKFVREFDINVQRSDTSYFERTEDHKKWLGSMMLNLQVTPSEEANHSVIESFLSGTPCLYSHSCSLSGINKDLDHLCLVDRIDDPKEIADKASALLSKEEDYKVSLILAKEAIINLSRTNAKHTMHCLQLMCQENEELKSLSHLKFLKESIVSNFGIRREDKLKYYTDVDRGFKLLKEKKVFICGIARDCESALRDVMIPKVEEFIPYLGDYHISIFENDSKVSSGDDTAKVLTEWGQKHKDNSHIVCEELNWGRIGGTRPNRTNRLAQHRNKCLTHLHKNFRHFDYMLVLDWDLRGGFSINGISHSIAMFEDLDGCAAITANSLNGSTKYYDAFAYRDTGHFGRYNKSILHAARRHGGRTIGSEMVQIGSGFNALGIYDVKKLCDAIDKEGPSSGNADSLKFGNLYGDGKNCEHVRLHAALHVCGYSVWLNPSLVVHY